MASVEPPNPTYVPNLPKEIVTSGALSEAQLENLIYAGQAHAKILKSGERRGYFIGDGTGVGKGRQIAGLILDHQRQGRQKHVWITQRGTLEQAAREDLQNLGMNPDHHFNLSKVAKAGQDV